MGLNNIFSNNNGNTGFTGGGGNQGFSFEPPQQINNFGMGNRGGKNNMPPQMMPPQAMPPQNTPPVPVNLNNPQVGGAPSNLPVNNANGGGGMSPMPFNTQQLQQLLANANPMLLRYLMMLNRGRF